jgi:hypothetical protein
VKGEGVDRTLSLRSARSCSASPMTGYARQLSTVINTLPHSPQVRYQNQSVSRRSIRHKCLPIQRFSSGFSLTGHTSPPNVGSGGFSW